MPSRILREGITTSDTIDALSEADENMLYRLLVAADDFGRLDARLAVVRGKCYPLKMDMDVRTIASRLSGLQRGGAIELYEAADHRMYIQILRPENPRAQKSKCPDAVHVCAQMSAEEIIRIQACTPVHSRIQVNTPVPLSLSDALSNSNSLSKVPSGAAEVPASPVLAAPAQGTLVTTAEVRKPASSVRTDLSDDALHKLTDVVLEARAGKKPRKRKDGTTPTAEELAQHAAMVASRGRYLARYRELFQSPHADFVGRGVFAFTALWRKHGEVILLASLEGLAHASPFVRKRALALKWACSQEGVEQGTAASATAPPSTPITHPSHLPAPPPRPEFTPEERERANRAREQAMRDLGIKPRAAP